MSGYKTLPAFVLVLTLGQWSLVPVWSWWYSWCQESQPACCTTQLPKCTTVPTCSHQLLLLVSEDLQHFNAVWWSCRTNKHNLSSPLLVAVLVAVHEWCLSQVILWLWMMVGQRVLLTTFQQCRGVNSCFALCLRPISINIHSEGKFSGYRPGLLLDLA